MSRSDNEQNLKHATVRGTTWTYGAFYSGKIIVFLSTVLLARLLTKDDFGVVAYATTIVGFLDVVKDLGIGAAFVYHNDEDMAPTAFWLGLVVGLGLFALLWFGAPLAGAFFRDPRAIPVVRVLAFNFPLDALGSTHEAVLVKQLAFNRKFIPDFAQALGKGVLSVGLAFAGLGPWSLIIGQLGGTLMSAAVLWFIVPWHPTLRFAKDAARSLVRFGLPLVGVNGLAFLVTNSDYLLVGRYLGPAAFGLYTIAFRIPELTILQFCYMVAQVVFPVFTKLRDDADALSRGFLQTARYVALVTVPAGLGLALLARPFVLTLFGDKWADGVPVLRAISLYALLVSLGYNAGDVYKAEGKPGVLMRLSLLKAAVVIPALYWAVTGPASVVAVGWVQAGSALFGSTVYLLVALRMLKVSAARLLEAFSPALTAGAGLAAAVLLTLFATANAESWVQLAVGTTAGGAAYLAVLWWSQRRLLLDTLKLMQGMLLRK